jgi:hypothetical protein
MVEERRNGSSLRPRVASAIWGWRLELGIGVVTAAGDVRLARNLEDELRLGRFAAHRESINIDGEFNRS